MSDKTRARLVSSCSVAMGEFVGTFAAANGITVSELIRQALAHHMDYELTAEDAEAPRTPRQRESIKRKPEILNKRREAIQAAMAQARRDQEARVDALRARVQETS